MQSMRLRSRGCAVGDSSLCALVYITACSSVVVVDQPALPKNTCVSLNVVRSWIVRMCVIIISTRPAPHASRITLQPVGRRAQPRAVTSVLHSLQAVVLRVGLRLPPAAVLSLEPENTKCITHGQKTQVKHGTCTSHHRHEGSGGKSKRTREEAARKRGRPSGRGRRSGRRRGCDKHHDRKGHQSKHHVGVHCC